MCFSKTASILQYRRGLQLFLAICTLFKYIDAEGQFIKLLVYFYLKAYAINLLESKLLMCSLLSFRPSDLVNVINDVATNLDATLSSLDKRYMNLDS